MRCRCMQAHYDQYSFSSLGCFNRPLYNHVAHAVCVIVGADAGKFDIALPAGAI